MGRRGGERRNVRGVHAGKNYGEIAAKLLKGGLESATPCIIVANATQAGQEIHRTTLRELALEERLSAPSVLIIGEVARPLPPVDEGRDGWRLQAPKANEVVLDLGGTRTREEITG